MPRYRDQLPQLSDDRFLTPGGLETTLVYVDKVDLPCFASFVLLNEDSGRARLRDFVQPYFSIAEQARAGLILGTVTWRANPEWGQRVGYSLDELAEANLRSVDLCAEIREQASHPAVRMPISGCVGPRGDGYRVGARQMSVEEAADYHRWQIEVFGDSEADFVTGATMSYAAEAAGIALAAKAAGIPAVISFTIETDGRIPDGSTLGEAISQVEDATDAAPAYYMVNCAYPDHLREAAEPEGAWVERLRGFRANASKRSHAELDGSQQLEQGNPAEFGTDCLRLLDSFPTINVFGGCCGTDHRHVEAIGQAWDARG